jgi:hypothetical protein
LKATVGTWNSTEEANSRSARCSLRRNVHWHVYICHFQWLIQDDSSKVNESCLRPASFVFHLGWSLLMTGLFALLTFSDSSEMTALSVQCKPALTSGWEIWEWTMSKTSVKRRKGRGRGKN